MKLLNELFSPSSWRLAWRDSKPQWRSLLLYTSSMIAGIAALVAILSFRSDVLLTVDDQSKELLGADLEMDSNQPYPEEAIAFIDSIGGSDANSIEFNSMVLFKKNGTTRLSQIRAIEGPFPIYGSIESEPADAADRYKEEKFALVEQSALNQYGVQVGDRLCVAWPQAGARDEKSARFGSFMVDQVCVRGQDRTIVSGLACSELGR